MIEIHHTINGKGVEGTSVINGHKCNKVTSVIKIGHKCNKVTSVITKVWSQM